MSDKGLIIVSQGASPPCLRAGHHICRGCAGWRAMSRATAPGGPWRGSLIHCPCTGLSAKGRDSGQD